MMALRSSVRSGAWMRGSQSGWVRRHDGFTLAGRPVRYYVCRSPTAGTCNDYFDKPADESPGQWSDPMLILTRRVGETLMIGDSVTVTVLGVKGNQVRIGINAPKDVAVHREEIYQRIKREQGG